MEDFPRLLSFKADHNLTLFICSMCQQKETVFIRVDFLKFGEIDTAKESYYADVFVQARWREPKYDQQVQLVGNKCDR